jgi:hypothetical protein
MSQLVENRDMIYSKLQAFNGKVLIQRGNTKNAVKVLLVLRISSNECHCSRMPHSLVDG